MAEKNELDISQQELIEEYGMTEENASKLLGDLPNIVQEFLKEAEAKAGAGAPPAGTGAPAEAGRYPYPYPKPQFSGNEDEDVDVLDNMIFITEKDLEDLKDISDEEIYKALDYLDQVGRLFDPLVTPLAALGGVASGQGQILGPLVGPALRPITGAPRTLLAMLLEEVFGLPTAPTTEPPTEETPSARRTPARPSRAPRTERRNFLTRVRAQANALDQNIANDEMPAFQTVVPFADKIIMTIDKDNFTIEDGVLKTNAVATANMVQKYGDKKVLKDADELKKAVDYSRMLPVTNDHPPEKIVTSQDQVKGWTGVVRFDESNKNIRCAVEITDADLIKKVQDGKTDVSIGFMCDMDNTPGELDGEKYDAVQRNIVLNHLAVVDSGRCPDGTCGLGMDHQESCTDDSCEGCKDQVTTPPPAKPDKKDAAGVPKSEAERAMTHFNISQEEWDKMSAEEQKKKIEELPPRGSGIDEDAGLEGEYILEEVEGHTHSVKLDKEGNGVSSTDGDHSHEVVKMECKEEGGHTHKVVPNPAKDDEPPTETTPAEAKPPEEKPAEDLDVSAHEKLLKEKVDAITALSEKLAKEAGTMSPQEIQALISDIEKIGWDLRDSTAVIQAKKLKVDEDVLNDAKDNMNLHKKLQTDNQAMFDEHAALVDEVMDHSPPREREFYAKKSTDELKELVLLLDQVDSRDSATSHSDDGHAKSVKDAFDGVVKKRLGKK